MPAVTEPQAERVRERLQESRAQIFALAHALKGDEPAEAQQPAEAGDGFPHSRIIRALLGERSRMLFGGAALVLTLMRPRVIWRLVRFAPLLRPLLMRYLLPRFLER
ncbi:MAG TPA: hypothetical protein VHX52_11055 [Steroidobacteraceae bacterium]|jgi:hypothetical protein|nr:hypothetical protein [Steroidobacteraceae bacterium]